MKNLKQIEGVDDGNFVDRNGVIYVSGAFGMPGFWRLPTKTTQKGYLIVSVPVKGKLKHLRVHRLVAQTFLPNPDNKPWINHKNGIKTDNRVANIEWCTPSENNLHSCYTLDSDSPHVKKPVVAFKNGVPIFRTDSVRLMAKKVKGAHTNISQVCNGKRKSYLGYRFDHAS